MNEFEELLNSVSEVSTGDVVTAEVISVDNDQANVVIEGTGIEGVLTRREFAKLGINLLVVKKKLLLLKEHVLLKVDFQLNLKDSVDLFQPQ